MKLGEFIKPSSQFRFVRHKDYFDMSSLVFCAVFLIFIINREVLCGTQRSNDRQIWSKFQQTVRPNTTQNLESIANKVYAIKTDTGIRFVPLKQNVNTKLKQKLVKNTTTYTNSTINYRVPINSIQLSSKVISLPQRLTLPSTVTPFKLNHQTPRKRKRPVITYESDNEEDEEDDDDEDDEDDDDDDDEGDDTEEDGEVTVIASDKHDYEGMGIIIEINAL